MPDLRATARVQLHRDFDLDAAAAQVPYYAALGISHLYLSPIGTARSGSLHGYDVIDPTQVNPELGGERALHRLSAALRAHRMGAIVDIVPNHMAADVTNPWWHDVLACGRQARHAGFFDIAWDGPGAGNRVGLPILEQPLDTMLAEGKLPLTISPTGTIELAVADQRLPLSGGGLHHLLDRAGAPPMAGSGRAAMVDRCARMLGDPSARLRTVIDEVNAEPEQMRHLLDLQHYRLAWWRSANQVLNYRRFFDISSLVALSVERREVFDAVHALPLRLIEEGLIDGLRIDHVDGLSHPAVYLRALRQSATCAARKRPEGLTSPVSIHVEKILAHGERLRRGPIDGSTGYDFMDQASALLHNPAGAEVLRTAWTATSGRSGQFDDEESAARREVLTNRLVAEFERCALASNTAVRAAGSSEHVANALGDLLLHVRVYRTYLGGGAARGQDLAVLSRAFAAVDEHVEHAGEAGRAALHDLLLHGSHGKDARAAQRLARRRIEQLSAPLNAKAVEDMSFYRHGVLLSRNEVGSDPRHFALSPAAFHHAAGERGRRWPRALLATATHDHKRGEDIRARLAVVSERAGEFVAEASSWLAELERIEPLPSAGDRWMLVQTILGAWPLDLHLVPGDAGTAATLREFALRIGEWQVKAVREAALRSSWTTPAETYEGACQRLVERLFGDERCAGLLVEMAAAAHRLDAPGALNGLATTTLKLTVPGVPDIYQGTEYWDQSLVDPDNRRPVDYATRLSRFDMHAGIAMLLRTYRDGRIKQTLIAHLLRARHDHPALFADGSHEALAIEGDDDGHGLAFLRRWGNERMLVVVPRLCASWLQQDDLPLVPAHRWADAEVILSPHDAACTWRDVFTNERHSSAKYRLALSRLLDRWPVAVLLATDPTDEEKYAS
jgi:(1->4)-alpha-D-glucan 1-alpha-D-glucosylmutase